MPSGMKLMLLLWAPLSMVPLALALSNVPIPQPFSYAWHKALHVLGAILFTGDLFTQSFWLAAARMSGSPAAVRAGYRALNWTDLAFLGPGMFLLIANGAVLSQAWGGIYRFSWMLGSLVLFGLYGVVSGPLMWIQMRAFKVLDTAPDATLIADLDRVTKVRGFTALLVAMLLVPLVLVMLMVIKPRLW